MESQPVLPGMPGPRVVEGILRVGLMVDDDHLQWQLEVRNPVTGQMLDMVSSPHHPADALGVEAARMVLRLVECLRAASRPSAGENP